MYSIKPLPEFTAWLNGLKDGMTHRRLARRLEKAQKGNLGDVKPVGDGVFEMKLDFGPGYRVYYARSGSRLVLLLIGGDKRKQQTDIATAIDYWQDWQRRNT